MPFFTSLTFTLSLNCFLLGDDSTKFFTVKVPKSDNVSILKEMIKEKKACHLAHLDASDLILWKVSDHLLMGLKLDSNSAFVAAHTNTFVSS